MGKTAPEWLSSLRKDMELISQQAARGTGRGRESIAHRTTTTGSSTYDRWKRMPCGSWTRWVAIETLSWHRSGSTIGCNPSSRDRITLLVARNGLASTWHQLAFPHTKWRR